jgi:multiple sugar transport system permease protein
VVAILFRSIDALKTFDIIFIMTQGGPANASETIHLIVSLPIIIWVMISFFEDVPSELEDAALIDGCSYLGVFGRIALPLVRPGVMATAILSFVFSWNNFLFSVILAGR